MKCPRCFRQMERRAHTEHQTAYLKKPYYFSEWDYCVACGFIKLYEEFKVYTTSESRSRKPERDISFACLHDQHERCLICSCDCHAPAELFGGNRQF